MPDLKSKAIGQKNIGVLRFLGTNCDKDVFEAVGRVQKKAEWLWYQDLFDYKKYDALIIPGGFSYGDYLRCGALAARAPAMKSVREAAEHGVPVLGICNGFQILCESGLLPGVLMRNQSLRFRDGWVNLNRVSQESSFCSSKIAQVRLPIAHGEGRYYLKDSELKKTQDNNQVWWTYETNPNGSINNIAGVLSAKKNVAGLMPHPERAMEEFMGGTDGVNFFI